MYCEACCRRSSTDAHISSGGGKVRIVRGGELGGRGIPRDGEEVGERVPEEVAGVDEVAAGRSERNAVRGERGDGEVG